MFGADRKVFPVGKDMNRDKIHRFIDFPVAKPIFPDVGIGDRNRNLRFDRANVGGEVGRGHLTAQQHFVTDHDGCNDLGVCLGQADRGRNLREVLQTVTAEPDPEDDFQPDFCGECRNLIEAVFQRIGAHTIGYFGKLRQILGNLFRGDLRGRHQRRLGVTERRIGHAQQLGAGIDRRPRQIDRRGQPPPHGSNRTQGDQEKRQWRTKSNRFHPPGGGPSISRSHTVCQERQCIILAVIILAVPPRGFTTLR